MSREIVKCEDGSFSVLSDRFGQTYHSQTGALAESTYVYMESALEYYCGEHPEKKALRIFEAGLGTGLDVLLTALEAEKSGLEIDYRVVELYPLEAEEWKLLKYGESLSGIYPGIDIDGIFTRIHSCPWGEDIEITEKLTLHKIAGDISDLSVYSGKHMENIDIVFFDAFSPDCQPELWSEEIFRALYRDMVPEGVLTTYSSKGTVKENLRQAGFFVKRLKGIGHKRHIVRAVRESRE